MISRQRPSLKTPLGTTRSAKWAPQRASCHEKRLPGRLWRPKRCLSVVGAVTSGGGRAGRGLEHLELKKRHSDFVEMIKPLFPFIKNWTLIDKCLITLSMIVVIRGLYFLPIHGVNPTSLPSNLKITSIEQKMLEQVFMAEDSVPLNIALLGITPLIMSGFLFQLILNVPTFAAIPGPFQGILNMKRMGVLTRAQIEKAMFTVAMLFGIIMAVQHAFSLRMFSTGVKYFFATVVMDLLAALSITHFCCHIIQHHGFGEGTGILLLSLTLSGFGKRLWAVATSVSQGAVPVWKVGVIAICYLALVSVCALFNEIQVRLPLTDYSTSLSRKPQRMETDALPLSRVQMPVPITSAPYFPLSISESAITVVILYRCTQRWIVHGSLKKFPALAAALGSSIAQNLLFATAAFLICLLPLGQNATNLSEYLSRMEVGIKGVIPGDPTVRHLRRKLTQSRLLGACFTFVLILCCLALDTLCAIWLGTPIGTLNLFLLVGVISSAFKTMEAHVDSMKVESVMQKEKDLMKLIQQDRTI